MLDEKPTRITKFEECAFSVIYKTKLVQSKDKFVYVHNQQGRPSRLISIPKPELGSSKASSSSIRKRSVIVETVLSSVLEPSTSKKEDQADNALTDDKIFQEASLIKRDKPLFVESARKAGIPVLSHGSIWKMSPLLRRSYHGNKSEWWNVLSFPGSGLMFSVPNQTARIFGKVRTVYKRMVQELVDTNSTEYLKHLDPNTLYVLLTGGKGGDSTKLLLQILNSDFSHSVRFATLIGIYEGDKEGRECVEAIFGGIIKDVQEISNSISSLNLRSHQICPLLSSEKQVTTSDYMYRNTSLSKRRQRRANSTKLPVNDCKNVPSEVTDMDTENKYVSKTCQHCKKSIISPDSTSFETRLSPGNEKIDACKCIFRDCVLVLGGDMMWIMCCMLGLTRPNGKAFCKDCLATLLDLEKGKTHSPHPPFKYSLRCHQGRHLKHEHSKIWKEIIRDS